jgi:molybdopterin/thiamine biosynthesis adenylyltransferase
MKVRSKKNNLLNYFIFDEKYLSKNYVKNCKKFLNSLSNNLKTKRIITNATIKKRSRWLL